MKKHIIDIGETVVCDQCSQDYSHSGEPGGLIVGSHAVCPRCEAGIRKLLKEFREENTVTAECPKGTSFRDFILAYRNGDNAIRISSVD